MIPLERHVRSRARDRCTSPVLRNSRHRPNHYRNKSPAVQYEPLWRSLLRLLDRVGTAVDRDDFVDDCLDTVVELLAADRGLIVLTEPDGTSFVINARGHNRALPPHERAEISRTIVRRVQESRDLVVWEPEAGIGGTESMAELGIITAMAAPLRRGVAGGNPLAGSSTGGSAGDPGALSLAGVLYVDFRDYRKQVESLHHEFFRAAASLLSIVLEQSVRLNRAQENLRAANAREAAHAGQPSLEELLHPHSMSSLRREVESCLHGDSPILIMGESGTGKTLFAQALAEASGKTPVVRAVLGASDDLNTITSELFGHEKGAYTGAIASRTGMVSFADGGTLILDEILNLPPHAQQLLLDFTQFGTYRPLGYERPEPRRARVRIIAATNGDLDAAMRSGKFRQDLYYRLAAVTLVLPPLRERRADIVELAENHLRRVDRVGTWTLSVSLRRLLVSASVSWPGNVRQLHAVIERARERAQARTPGATMLLAEHLEPRDLGLGALPTPDRTDAAAGTRVHTAAFQIDAEDLGDSWDRLQAERRQLEDHERRLIGLALDRYGGTVAYAAREFGLGRTSLLSRMQTLGVARPDRPAPPQDRRQTKT